MGFNKKYLPSLEEIKKKEEKDPEYIRHLAKADALIGPTDSMDYVEAAIAALKEKEKESHSK
jgi:hypothetical protein